MMALLPPNSSRTRPRRAWTFWPTSRPIAVEPVAETSGMRRSRAIFSPTASRPPIVKLKIAGSTPLARQTRSAILIVAMAQSGVWPDGFQSGGVAADRGQGAVPGPHGHGKIERANDADDAERMPLFHHAVLRAFGSNGQAIKLPGKADRKIANIDHLLNLAFAFRQNFPRFQRDQPAEVGFGRAQRVAKLADDFAAFRRRDGLPNLKGLAGLSPRPVRNRPPWPCAPSPTPCRQWGKCFLTSARRPSIRRKKRPRFPFANQVF